MPDDNTNDAAPGQTAEGAGKQDTTGAGSGADTQAAKSTEGDEKTFSQTELNRIVKRETERAVKAAQEAAQKAANEAAMTEAEKLKLRVEAAEKERDDARTELRRTAARDKALHYLTDPQEKVGARNPRAVLRMIEPSFEYDDETGEITNLKPLIQQVKREAPELFILSGGSANGGAGRTTQAHVDMNSLIRQAAGRN